MALTKANVRKDELDAVAVTYGAGLLGALLVGLSYAKGRKPLVIPRMMCEVELTAELVIHLLTKGKSPLIKDFVSRKSGKKFEAYLVFNSTSGRISYEFPPRK